MSHKAVALSVLGIVLALDGAAIAAPKASNKHDECGCRDTRHRHSRRDCGPSTRVPELSANAAGGAAALVVGGLMVLAGKRRRKS